MMCLVCKWKYLPTRHSRRVCTKCGLIQEFNAGPWSNIMDLRELEGDLKRRKAHRLQVLEDLKAPHYTKTQEEMRRHLQRCEEAIAALEYLFTEYDGPLRGLIG